VNEKDTLMMCIHPLTLDQFKLLIKLQGHMPALLPSAQRMEICVKVMQDQSLLTNTVLDGMDTKKQQLTMSVALQKVKLRFPVWVSMMEGGEGIDAGSRALQSARCFPIVCSKVAVCIQPDCAGRCTIESTYSKVRAVIGYFGCCTPI
jgi:hypothetical protein